MLINLIFFEFNMGIFYLLCFITVRIFSGGYHSTTHFRCSLAMISFYLLFIFIYKKILTIDVDILLVGVLLAYIPIIIYSPVINENRPLSEYVRRKSRQRAIIVYSLWLIMSLIFIFFGMKQGRVIIATLWIISINIIFAQCFKFMKGCEQK